MNTRAPELRALIIIFGSAGPVISTRRSSRSAGAGATVQSASRTAPGRGAGSRAGRPRRAPPGAPRGGGAGRAGPGRSGAGGRPRTRAPRRSGPARSPATGRAGRSIAWRRHHVGRRSRVGRSPRSARAARSSRRTPRRRWSARTAQVDQPVVEVRQDHPDLVDRLVAFEDRPGHDPDRRLDGRAVVLGEDLEQRVARTAVERARRSRAPASRSARSRVIFVAISRSSASGRVVYRSRGKPAERRARRLHHDQVLDAGLDRRPAAGRRDRGDPRSLPAADEGVAGRRAGHVDRPPVLRRGR